MGILSLAGGDREEPVLDLLRDRTAVPGTHRDAVDGPDRRYLHGAAHEEHLVGDVEHFPGDVLFDDLEPGVLGERHDGVAGDAAEDRGRQAVRDDPALLHDEDVLAATFADQAIGVQRNAFAVPVLNGFHADELGIEVVTSGLGQGGVGIWRGTGPGRDAHVDAVFQYVVA